MIYGYIRCSTSEQSLSSEAQRDCIERYCAAKGLTLTAIYEDLAVSGGIHIARRPGGKAMLASITKGDIIVAAKLDRLFRSVADAAMTINSLCERGIFVISVGEGFDMSTSYGRAMAQMASVFAELERSMIRERTKAALDAKRRRGEKVSGNVAYGQRDIGDGKVGDAPEEKAAIVEILAKRSAGLSLRKIAMSMSVPARKGRWYPGTVQRIINKHRSIA